jgi:endonuclease G
VRELVLDSDDKFSVISGPVFGDFMRTIRPDGQAAAFVPAAFFKIVFFVNRQAQLDVRAFLLAQDEAALRDKRGRRLFDHQAYQVSIAEIEALTGLDFPDVLPERNPLFFNPSTAARNANVTELPERREVNGPADILRVNDAPRDITFADDTVDVFIAAVMVNPKGEESRGEWVSLVNLTAAPISIDGWVLKDSEQRSKALSGKIGPGEGIRIQPVRPMSFANQKPGFVQLIDDRNRQIDRVPWTKEQASREGKPIVFAYREVNYDPRG